MTLRRAALAGLLAVLAGFTMAAGPRAGADGPAGPALVERVRIHALPDGRFAEERFLIDPSLGDPEGLGADPDASSPGEVSAQFELWRRWDDGALPVRVAYNAASEPEGVDGATVVELDMSTWNAVPGQDFQFAWGGPTAAGYGGCDNSKSGDGVNSISWGAPSAANILASTCALLDGEFFTVPGETKRVPGIDEFDMLINPDAKWSSAAVPPPGMYDLYSTVLHELGHALGLDHSNAPGAVMSPTLGAGKMVRTPTTDDVNALLALYGDGSPQLPPPSPSPLPPLGYSVQFAGMSRDN
jgi:hypothetical protein